MSFSIQQLRKMSDEEIIKLHDECALSTCVGVSYYIDELKKREQERYAKTMMNLTVICIIVAIISVLINLLK